MKTKFALSLLATAAMAEQYSAYSEKFVNDTRRHLEKVYGKGLTEMFDHRGKMTSERLSWAHMRPRANYIDIGGKSINADFASAWIYGFIGGLQYTAMTKGDPKSIGSSCFYSMFGLVERVTDVAQSVN